MAEKIEHRLDEYREYESGKWGPWQKLDGRLFDGDVASAAGPEEYGIYEKWRFGKIESKDAWAALKKLRAIYYEWANDTSLNKPDRRHIAAAYQAKYEKIEIYLKEIGDRIIQDRQPGPGIKKASGALEEEAAVQRTAGVSKDPAKALLNWLKIKQLAKHYTEEAQPVSTIGDGITFTQKKDEWRIAKNKTVTSVYRELVSAAIKKEIPLAESEVPGFMLNYLKNKDGSDITKNAVDKAAKVRLKQPKSA